VVHRSLDPEPFRFSYNHLVPVFFRYVVFTCTPRRPQIKRGRSSSDLVWRRKTPPVIFFRLTKTTRALRPNKFSETKCQKKRYFFYMNKITRSYTLWLTGINHWSKSKPYINPVSLIFCILWYHPNHLFPYLCASGVLFRLSSVFLSVCQLSACRSVRVSVSRLLH
jgi:hypothetical protein